MKIKILIISGLITLLSFVFEKPLNAQVSNSEKLDENRLVYWFYINVRDVEDSNTGMVSYGIQRKGTKIEHGTIKEYDRELWKFLGEGSKMAIGPFNDFDEAKKSFLLYNIQDEPHEMDSTFNETQTVFWFILHVERRPRSGSYKLIRVPGAIASGYYREFESFVKEQLKTRVLAIGPFVYMPEAEESKRIYRLH
jgi:hypothetical protein